MDRTPDWTIDEFETLIRHPQLTEVELKDVVRGHSAVAIAIVREGVHSWHRGQPRHHAAVTGHEGVAGAPHHAGRMCGLPRPVLGRCGRQRGCAVHPHQLRHRFAAAMEEAGATVSRLCFAGAQPSIRPYALRYAGGSFAVTTSTCGVSPCAAISDRLLACGCAPSRQPPAYRSWCGGVLWYDDLEPLAGAVRPGFALDVGSVGGAAVLHAHDLRIVPAHQPEVAAVDERCAVIERFQAPLRARITARCRPDHDIRPRIATARDGELLAAPRVADGVVAVVGMGKAPQLTAGIAPAAHHHVDPIRVAAAGDVDDLAAGGADQQHIAGRLQAELLAAAGAWGPELDVGAVGCARRAGVDDLAGLAAGLVAVLDLHPAVGGRHESEFLAVVVEPPPLADIGSISVPAEGNVEDLVAVAVADAVVAAAGVLQPPLLAWTVRIARQLDVGAFVAAQGCLRTVGRCGDQLAAALFDDLEVRAAVPNLPAAGERVAQRRPAVAPGDLAHREPGQAAVVDGVVVVHVPRGRAVDIDIAMPRTGKLVVPSQQLRAAAVEQGETALVDIGAGDVGGTTDDDAVLTCSLCCGKPMTRRNSLSRLNSSKMLRKTASERRNP